MKAFHIACCAGTTAALFVTSNLLAQAPSVPATDSAAAANSGPQKLPYGVDDVLKLSRAKISEGVILNYVQNSGTIYSLGAKDIVYLRDQGVSDTIVNAMQDQRKRVPEQAAQSASTLAQVASLAPSAEAAAYSQPASAYTPAPAPEPMPAPSTLHVISSPEKHIVPYYYRYPYIGQYGLTYYGPTYYGGYCGVYPRYGRPYGGYFRFGTPALSLGFGYGKHGHGGSYHGGYHGAYRR